MPLGQSVLLGRRLPVELEKCLQREGFDPRQALLCARTDLDLTGRYKHVFLVVFPDRLLTVAEPDAEEPQPIRLQLPREEIREIRTRSGVGGGFLEALIEGIYVEVLAFSNAEADTFHRAAEKLKAWQAGEAFTVAAIDDVNPRRCATCGMTLQFPGDVCRKCINRGAVLLRVLQFMKPYAGKAAVMMALVLVGIGVSLLPQKLVQLLVDRVLAPEKAGNPTLAEETARLWLLGLVGGLLAIHLANAVVQALAGRLGSTIGNRVTHDMRTRVFDHLTGLGVDYYDRHSTGQLMSRVTYDTQLMRGFVMQLTSGFLAQLITVAVVGAMLFAISWQLAMFTLLPGPIVVLLTVFFWKRIYPRYYRMFDATSKLQGALSSFFQGFRVVKAFGQERHERRRFANSSSYIRDSSRNVEYAVSTFNPAVVLLFQLGGVIVWYVGGRHVLAGRGFTLGRLMQFLGYLAMFYHPLMTLSQLTNWLTSFFSAMHRTFEILDTPPQVRDADNPVRLAKSKGAIAFEKVTFGYEPHHAIIKGVSFQIAPGEHVGFVGKSGSGKTTLMNLVSRFYDVDGGRVLIDGIDVRQLDMTDLHRAVGVVLQQPFLFRGTIYSNITYGRRDVSPEDVIAATKAANAHDFIMDQSLGYDTYIGDNGAGLSGGEKQRVSIARALLFDPRILILDEATSSVDVENETKIQQALERIMRGRTTIAIAHRLSTLKNCNRIFAVEEGRIAESGTHEELLEKRGLYYRLVKIQTELARTSGVEEGG